MARRTTMKKYVDVQETRGEIRYHAGKHVLALACRVATRAGELWLCKLTAGTTEIWPRYTKAAAKAAIMQELHARGYELREPTPRHPLHTYAPVVALLAIMVLALVVGAIAP